MAIELKFRRGTTRENDALVGATGELTIDTEKKQIRLHDGTTSGGVIIGEGGSGKGDDISITKNSADELQTVGVIDSKTGNSIKEWTGTLAEYEAIATKDENTTYYIVDDYQKGISLCTLPIGTIVPYAGDTAPDGWLICDGSEKSRIEYSKLFNALGTKYGKGDGSTTFNLPDLCDRVPIMAPAGTNDGTSGNGWVPNITGKWVTDKWGDYLKEASGAFYNAGGSDNKTTGGSMDNNVGLGFDASRCSDVYKNDKTTVLPAYTHALYIVKYKDVSDEKEDLLNLIYPAGSIYLGTQETCPLEIIISGSTWEKIGTQLMTDVTGSKTVPVKGNGMTLGFTNGTTLTGITESHRSENVLGVFSDLYGTDVGTTASGSKSEYNKSLGVTADSTKSGIIADISNSLTKTNITLNIWKRIA